MESINVNENVGATTLIEAKGKMWLSEILNELPHNSYLNKVITGCGGTTIAIKSELDYVICVPFRALIENKVAYCEANDISVLGVKGGVTESDILDYIKKREGKRKLFFVTYDSIEKLTNIINPLEYNILVDEAHKLIDSGSFRGRAVRKVMTNYLKYRSFCLMTATPVKDKHQLLAMRELPQVKIVWDKIEPVNFNFSKVVNPNGAIIRICESHIKGNISGNAHIFVNSVKMIIDIVKRLKSITSDIKIIVGDNSKANIKLEIKGGNDLLGSTTTNACKLNFYTATAFEGSDIFDTEGRTYIVTDGYKDHTKYDISTTIPQIIGRIRNSVYKNEIHLIYSESNIINNLTEEEFEQQVLKNIICAEEIIDTFNNSENSMMREVYIKGVATNAFILEENGELFVNDTVWYSEMHNFSILKNNYFILSDKAYLFINDLPYNCKEVSNLEKEEEEDSLNNKLVDKDRITFKELCFKYQSLFSKSILSLIEDELNELKLIKQKEPIIAESYKVLGADRIANLKYSKTMLGRELIIIDKKKENITKIKELLNYRVGDFKAATTIKKDLCRVYKELGIDDNSKATDLSFIYNIQKVTRRIEGVSTGGFIIGVCKIK